MQDFSAPDQSPLLYDPVRLPDGRDGTVIGFYRSVPEMLLVLLPSGESVEVAATRVTSP
jgi:hypothetical protein